MTMMTTTTPHETPTTIHIETSVDAFVVESPMRGLNGFPSNAAVTSGSTKGVKEEEDDNTSSSTVSSGGVDEKEEEEPEEEEESTLTVDDAIEEEETVPEEEEEEVVVNGFVDVVVGIC